MLSSWRYFKRYISTVISIFEGISGAQAQYITVSIQVYFHFFLVSFVFPIVCVLKLIVLVWIFYIIVHVNWDGIFILFLKLISNR